MIGVRMMIAALSVSDKAQFLNLFNICGPTVLVG